MGRGAGLEAGDWGGVERVRWGVRGGRVRGTERAGACVEVLGGEAGGLRAWAVVEAWRMWMGGRRMRGSVGMWGCVCGVGCGGEEGRSSVSAGSVELCRTIACGGLAVRA